MEVVSQVVGYSTVVEGVDKVQKVLGKFLYSRHSEVGSYLVAVGMAQGPGEQIAELVLGNLWYLIEAERQE